MKGKKEGREEVREERRERGKKCDPDKGQKNIKIV